MCSRFVGRRPVSAPGPFKRILNPYTCVSQMCVMTMKFGPSSLFTSGNRTSFSFRRFMSARSHLDPSVAGESSYIIPQRSNSKYIHITHRIIESY